MQLVKIRSSSMAYQLLLIKKQPMWYIWIAEEGLIHDELFGGPENINYPHIIYG